jgi:hypothetical protein
MATLHGIQPADVASLRIDQSMIKKKENGRKGNTETGDNHESELRRTVGQRLQTRGGLRRS